MKSFTEAHLTIVFNMSHGHKANNRINYLCERALLLFYKE